MNNEKLNKVIESACNGGFSKSTKSRIVQKIRDHAEHLAQEITEAQEAEDSKKPVSVFNLFSKK